MPAYLVGRGKILDQAKVDAYGAAAMPIVEKYGGKMLAAGPSVRNLEGPKPDGDLIVIEFASREQAEAFWDDPNYQEVAKLRVGALDLELNLVEGS